MERSVRVGCRVAVPFGAGRTLTGFVVAMNPPDPPEELRSLHELVDDDPLLDGEMLDLGKWIAERTLCSWGDALRAMLPGHTAPRREKVLRLGAPVATTLFGTSEESDPAERALAAVAEEGELSTLLLAKRLGMRVADLRPVVQQLIRSKRILATDRAVSRASSVPRIKVVALAGDAEAGEELARRAPVQHRCVEFLREAGGDIPLRDLAEAVAGARGAVRALTRKKLVRVRLGEWETEDAADFVTVSRHEPNAEQASAIGALTGALGSLTHQTFLLHGVTGSGKTEVYLRAMEEARRLGGHSILLVPEITLTPQMVSCVRGRFGRRAAVLHSRLTDAERRRTRFRARRGDYDVVLGPRSAVFTPLPNLRLVVIDEEHDGAYKQEDAPRYHARDVAIERARRAGATVVLGTATPDLETWHRASGGKFSLLRLGSRVSALPLPEVELVDQRGGRGAFSGELLEAIGERLARREQTILFLNRRGFSPFVQCVTCGMAVRCGACDVSLTFHKSDGTLRCHYCDHEEPRLDACAACGARTLVYRGAGTQRIEEDLRERFPKMHLARLDSDSVQRRGAHEEILGAFLDGKVDVLLGTQMVAKGLDFPRVTLVGVINADTGLHLPDFRSAERTFQLLAQVAGRAGRSELGGKVLIQTRCPEHACLAAARTHDDAAFRESEMEQRKAMGYPPFAKLAAILVRGPNLGRTEGAAEVVRDRMAVRVQECAEWTVVLGPAAAPIAQVRGKHRFHLLVKGRRRADVRRVALAARGAIAGYADVEVQVDVDPVSML
jgi:primosomal protein N' (replication factor Y)